MTMLFDSDFAPLRRLSFQAGPSSAPCRSGDLRTFTKAWIPRVSRPTWRGPSARPRNSPSDGVASWGSIADSPRSGRARPRRSGPRLRGPAGPRRAGDVLRRASLAPTPAIRRGKVQRRCAGARDRPHGDLLFFALELNRLDDASRSRHHGRSRSAITGPGSWIFGRRSRISFRTTSNGSSSKSR